MPSPMMAQISPDSPAFSGGDDPRSCAARTTSAENGSTRHQRATQIGQRTYRARLSFVQHRSEHFQQLESMVNKSLLQSIWVSQQ